MEKKYGSNFTGENNNEHLTDKNEELIDQLIKMDNCYNKFDYVLEDNDSFENLTMDFLMEFKGYS